ncbi:hypothetical protein FRC12_016620 [Ceratobasidium sp. 428]|nr:hypothetical protein FRC12_016620 [Ceratobasidium sp. 428]
MPSAEGMRHFKQGITGLSQWTGRESKEVEKQLLPVIASIETSNWDSDIVRLSRALLDFIYRAQASQMTDDDLGRLDSALAEFHQLKRVLIEMGVFENDARFDYIAKLHMIGHMIRDTQQMGTPDGFSTESPEHMHIESKRAWRASNKVRPTPQMIKFIQRYEALRIHRSRLNTYLGRTTPEGGKRRTSHVVYGEDEEPFQPACEVSVGHEASGFAEEHSDKPGKGPNRADENSDSENDEEEDVDQVHFAGRMKTAADARRRVVYPNPTLSIALKPTAGKVRGLDIVTKYGATALVPALHAYLKKHGTRKDFPRNFLPTAYHEYPVWHRLYLRHRALPFDPEWPRRDVIRARPQDADHDEAFDVGLFLDRRREYGLARYRAGRVRAIFALPPTLQFLCPYPLVYVELFTSFSAAGSPFHGMHSLSHQLHPDGTRRSAVLSIFSLAAACHLAPQFRRLDPGLDLTSFPDLLSVSRYFWLNHYYNRFIFRLVEHWRFARDAARNKQ